MKIEKIGYIQYVFLSFSLVELAYTSYYLCDAPYVNVVAQRHPSHTSTVMVPHLHHWWVWSIVTN